MEIHSSMSFDMFLLQGDTIKLDGQLLFLNISCGRLDVYNADIFLKVSIPKCLFIIIKQSYLCLKLYQRIMIPQILSFL